MKSLQADSSIPMAHSPNKTISHPERSMAIFMFGFGGFLGGLVFPFFLFVGFWGFFGIGFFL